MGWYWSQVEGNVLAVPLCAAVAAVGFLFRDRIGRRVGRWLAGHVAPHLREQLAAHLRELTAPRPNGQEPPRGNDAPRP